MKAKLIFNPAAGNPVESVAQLFELQRNSRTQQVAAVVLVPPEMRLSAIARSAARAASQMMIVSRGDGKIENVVLGLVGSRTAFRFNRVRGRLIANQPSLTASWQIQKSIRIRLQQSCATEQAGDSRRRTARGQGIRKCFNPY